MLGSMIRIRISIVFIVFCNMALAQDQHSNTYELKDVLFNKEKIWKLISDRSESYKLELGPVDEHPYKYHRITSKIPNDSVKYTFLGLPADDIYAYTVDKDKFSIFLTAYLDLPAIERLFSLLGKSENFDEENPIPLSEYDIFSWTKPDLRILISKGMFGQYRRRFRIEIRTNNLRYKDVLRPLGQEQ